MGGVPGLWVAAVALPLVHLGVTRLVPCSEPCGAGSGYTGGGAAWIPGGPVVPTGLFLSLDTSALIRSKAATPSQTSALTHLVSG